MQGQQRGTWDKALKCLDYGCQKNIYIYRDHSKEKETWNTMNLHCGSVSIYPSTKYIGYREIEVQNISR